VFKVQFINLVGILTPRPMTSSQLRRTAQGIGHRKLLFKFVVS